MHDHVIVAFLVKQLIVLWDRPLSKTLFVSFKRSIDSVFDDVLKSFDSVQICSDFFFIFGSILVLDHLFLDWSLSFGNERGGVVVNHAVFTDFVFSLIHHARKPRIGLSITCTTEVVELLSHTMSFITRTLSALLLWVNDLLLIDNLDQVLELCKPILPTLIKLRVVNVKLLGPCSQRK